MVRVAAPKKYDYDVVIVGYGPTGQACASLLARLGHRVCAYERWPTLYGLPRLIGFDAESARMTQAAGDVNVALRESFPIRRYITYDRDMNKLVEYQWGDDHQCGYPIKTATYQPFIEDAMDETARDRGVRVNTGWRVTNVVQDADGVDVTAEPWSKEEVGENLKPALSKTARAKYVVGADGAKSVVREVLGVERETMPYRDAWLSVDIERRECLPTQFMYGTSWQVADVGNVIVVVPAGTKRMRFEFQVDPDGDHTQLLKEDVGYRMLEERLGITSDHVEIVRLTIYPFGAMIANEWRRDRVFLAGDAAHLMPPFLGEGAASGMRDAVTLAWKLDLVLRGLADPSFLDTYQVERYPHVRHHVVVSVAIGEIVTERDHEVAEARNAELREGDAPPPPADPTLTTGILMRDADGGLVTQAGELAPQGWVHHDGRTGRFDDVVGWGFHLVARDQNPLELLDREQREFLDAIRCMSVGVSNEERPGLAMDITWIYDRWFEDNGVAAFLMRPDFYLFGTVASVEGVPALVDALREQLGVKTRAGGQPVAVAP
jgi:3-(3-hydroxy-phenyl)propionate hydroxylase